MFTNAVTDMVGDEMLDCSKSSRVHSLGLQEFSMSIWHEFKSISNDATMQHKMQKESCTSVCNRYKHGCRLNLDIAFNMVPCGNPNPSYFKQFKFRPHSSPLYKGPIELNKLRHLVMYFLF